MTRGRFPRLFVVAGTVFAAIGATAPAAAAAEETERFLVGLREKPGKDERRLIQSRGARVRYEFDAVRALAVEGPPSRVRELVRARGVRYVERDPPRFALGLADAELVPSLSNGLYGLLRTRATDAHAAGVTGAGANVCVADEGLDADHVDIAPNFRGGIDVVANPDDGDPDVGNDADETHGTHVAGTAAGALTAAGVRGVAYGAELYHARVLSASGGSSSDVMAGVRHLVEARGCRVVNLSLGGGDSSATEEAFFEEMHGKGALIVAAAGNEGASALIYPAGYDVVLSVGAVDAGNAHASFSNTGPGLDVAAPGVAVLSSVPDGAGFESSVTSGAEYQASGLEHAGQTSGVTRTLVDSGTGNSPSEFPSSVAGNIALIQRGGDTFASKVQRAMDAGAVAAVIYNNQPGNFLGTLGSSTANGGAAWVPTVSVSDSDGAALRSRSGSSATVVNTVSSWAHFNGTSMATPHVAGAAGLVFANNPGISNDEVEARLKGTAVDLGSAGYDATFGHGLVDAHAAAAAATSSAPSGGSTDGAVTSDAGGGGAGGGATGTPPASGAALDAGIDRIDPIVRALRLSSRRFRAARRGASIAAPVGTRLTYRLSEAARTRFRVERAARGRRSRRSCVRPTRRNRRGRSCIRWLRLRGSFEHRGRPGSNRLTFRGRLAGRALRPRLYRLVAVSTDAAGNRGRARRIRFRIVR